MNLFKYPVSVKKSILLVSFLALFASALVSCQNSQTSDMSSSSKSEPSSKVEPRLVAKEDYLVDFSVGDSSAFTYANGYKNGLPFDCTWSRNAIQVENGTLNLNLYKQNNIIYGAEYRSKAATFHYGYYATRMKAADCSGVVSSFFTYTNNPVWDEIDIEFLGKDMTSVQFNYYTNGVGGHEYVYNLGYDASKSFHEYGFDWKEDRIDWYVDGIKVYTHTEDIPSHPQQLMMNLWNCTGKDGWTGPFDESKLPVQSQYEFIAYLPANN